MGDATITGGGSSGPLLFIVSGLALLAILLWFWEQNGRPSFLSPAYWRRHFRVELLARFTEPNVADAQGHGGLYGVLGVPPQVNAAMIKFAYGRAMARYPVGSHQRA